LSHASSWKIAGEAELFRSVSVSLGGYTTFSSLEWETCSSVREGGLWTGMLNVVSSVMLGYVAVTLGSMLARR
jgi:CrcB protein